MKPVNSAFIEQIVAGCRWISYMIHTLLTRSFGVVVVFCAIPDYLLVCVLVECYSRITSPTNLRTLPLCPPQRMWSSIRPPDVMDLVKFNCHTARHIVPIKAALIFFSLFLFFFLFHPRPPQSSPGQQQRTIALGIPTCVSRTNFQYSLLKPSAWGFLPFFEGQATRTCRWPDRWDNHLFSVRWGVSYLLLDVIECELDPIASTRLAFHSFPCHFVWRSKTSSGNLMHSTAFSTLVSHALQMRSLVELEIFLRQSLTLDQHKCMSSWLFTVLVQESLIRCVNLAV